MSIAKWLICSAIFGMMSDHWIIATTRLILTYNIIRFGNVACLAFFNYYFGRISCLILGPWRRSESFICGWVHPKIRLIIIILTSMPVSTMLITIATLSLQALLSQSWCIVAHRHSLMTNSQSTSSYTAATVLPVTCCIFNWSISVFCNSEVSAFLKQGSSDMKGMAGAASCSYRFID